MAVTGLLTALVTVVTISTADAKYTATTASGASWTAGAHYTCAQAAASPAAQLYYPLQETTGTVAAESGTGDSGTYDGTYEPGFTLGVPGPNCRGANRAVSLDGTGYITSPLSVTNPSTFSLETWFRTGTAGGLVMGFRRDVNGADNDRMIYMSDDGRLNFGVEATLGSYRTVSSGPGYADDSWHHVVATLGDGDLALYVDGRLMATDLGTTGGFNATGTWRMGRGQVDGWPGRPTNRFYIGSLAHAAVYTSVLDGTQVQQHWYAGR